MSDRRAQAARNRRGAVGSPVGPIEVLLPPVSLEGDEARMDPIPDVGEHTDAILRSLGYAEDRVRDLRSRGVI